MSRYEGSVQFWADPKSALVRRRARDLEVGDVFRLHIYGEILAVSPVADGKRMKVRIELEDQGRRENNGGLSATQACTRKIGIEFTDDRHVLEFLCSPGRLFNLVEWSDDDDDNDRDGEFEPGPVPSPDEELV